jgi:hypothetical protein
MRRSPHADRRTRRPRRTPPPRRHYVLPDVSELPRPLGSAYGAQDLW